jgi:ankyrin repeat protein
MTRSLPPRPSLEHLKNQAKELLRDARQGVADALARFPSRPRPRPRSLDAPASENSPVSHSPPSSDSRPDSSIPSGKSSVTWKLADAQHVVAREYGFSNWAELRQHVDDLAIAAKSRDEQIVVLTQCCLEGELSRAARMLARHPDLATSDIFTAAMVGELACVRELLDQDPTLVHRRGGPLDATPLVYACSSRFASPDHVREPQMRAVVIELLRHKAEPNSSYIHATLRSPLSALYGACGVNGNVELTQRLLEAGANPDDNESLYHSVEHRNTECTELLLAQGATITGTNAVHHAIACSNIPALQLFLQHGVNIDERIAAQQDMTLLQWAIECNQPRDVLELLVSRGADLRAKSRDGMTPFRRAVHCGHRAAVELLTQHGAAEPLSSPEEFVAACMMGDSTRAQQCVAAFPDIMPMIALHGRGLLYAAAWRGNLDAVTTMLEVGFDVAWTNHEQATALHAAAWNGYVQLVQRLLQHGAPLHGKDTQFHCTPLEWALHGSCNCPQRDDHRGEQNDEAAYAAIAELLMTAGSPRPLDRFVRTCAEQVTAVLEAAGVMVEDED